MMRLLARAIAVSALVLPIVGGCESFRALLREDAPTPVPQPELTIPSAAAPLPKNLLAAPAEAIPLPAAPPAIVQRGAAPAAPPSPTRVSPPVSANAAGDVTLNFADTDIREVVRGVLGDVLGLNYVIDPKVQGTVTVQTSRPLPRSAVLPTLEQVLRASGAVMIQEDGLIRVLPLEIAAKGGGAPRSLGYGVQVIPLQYASAGDLKRILDPFVPLGAVLQADPPRNLLLVSGTRQDLEGLLDLVRSFDVDTLAQVSFALVPLRASAPETIVSELAALTSSRAEANAAALVRFIPIARINAVLVVTRQPKYLDWARATIARLDEGNEDGAERTYVYRVQHGRAADVADVLRQMYGGGRSRSGAATVGQRPLGGSFSSEFGGGETATGGGAAPGGGLPGIAAAPPPAPSGASAGAASPAPSPAGDQSPPASPLDALGAGAQPLGAEAPERTPIRIVADERNNALLIVTSPREYRRLEATLARLDVMPLQVVIEATVAEVTLTNELRFGVEWFFRQRSSTFTFTNVPSAVPAQIFPGFSYLLSQANAQVVLNALASLTRVDVISSPQILVLNNETAQLQVGNSVPVPVQQAQSVVTAGAPLVNTVQYRDTGVILRVTPRANANGEVLLDIEQEVSDVSPTAASAIGPTIEERRIKSTVTLESGDTVALGGLISDNKTKTRTAVPILGDIPILGALFRNDDITTIRTELLVLIQPRIINGSAEARAATDDLRRRLKAMEPLTRNGH